MGDGDSNQVERMRDIGGRIYSSLFSLDLTSRSTCNISYDMGWKFFSLLNLPLKATGVLFQAIKWRFYKGNANTHFVVIAVYSIVYNCTSTLVLTKHECSHPLCELRRLYLPLVLCLIYFGALISSLSDMVLFIFV